MKFFSLIYQGEVHPSTEEKIIAAEDFSILLEANELLLRATEDAEKYKKETQKKCAALRKEAKAEGFQEGLTEFNEHLLQFDEKLRLLRLELQKQILPLALKAAKKIVSEQLQVHPETIVDIVLQTLAPIAQNQKFIIYVNKTDKDLLEAEKTRIKEILEHVQSLTIQERPDISSGGCIIETESGIINATIENQWRALETAFERYLKQAPPPV